MPTTASTETEPIILTVPRSSFDLLEGQFVTALKARTLNRAVAAVMACLVAILFFSGVATNKEADEIAAQNAVVEQEVQAVSLELRAKAQAGAATKSQVESHVKERLVLVDYAVGGLIDYERLLREIDNLAPGTTITNLSFAADGAAPADDGNAASTIPTSTAAPTNAAPTVGSVTISGTAVDIRSANAALIALTDTTRFPYLIEAGAAPVRCGAASEGEEAAAAGACSWTWTGQLTEAATVSRADTVAATYGIELDGGGS